MVGRNLLLTGLRYNSIMEHCKDTAHNMQRIIDKYYSTRSTSKRPAGIPGKVTAESIRDAAVSAEEKMVKYYDVSSEHATIAVVMDPRFKLDFYTEKFVTSEANKAARDEKFNQVQETFSAEYEVTRDRDPKYQSTRQFYFQKSHSSHPE